MKFTALVAFIKSEEEEEAIKFAKEEGAGSVTIISGKTIGLEEKKIFFGLTLEENVSILIFILPIRLSRKVMRSLRGSLDLDNIENRGLIFSIPLSHVAGLDFKELQNFEDNIKTML
jgi:hypothetical protein